MLLHKVLTHVHSQKRSFAKKGCILVRVSLLYIYFQENNRPTKLPVTIYLSMKKLVIVYILNKNKTYEHFIKYGLVT